MRSANGNRSAEFRLNGCGDDQAVIAVVMVVVVAKSGGCKEVVNWD